ncbi:WecB/TagA/CpsF family glycosyltransferase [Fervidibacillus halotolerans]|uniref:N-acetylglucosaminyldiphosphoundecaprenol N-acetyl-beta-D-mannosaminyltransferase n=1 Tax=Fervidibacillus halotolerans TaxID=2980027 RepID=A0A9E8RWV2_9BACI|nr:WecB/TagA/CpsF family glycosyltransferase [Fervidibacillus halotolerans]WAA12135.1 WecB/TagA/CpsF family glycosyltransferase [Fervidibacillus halotolerans]
MKCVNIMGIPFFYTDQSSFIQLLDERIQQKKRTFVVTANPEIVMKAKEDADFKNTILQATYITADGIGIVKAAKLLKDPLPGRVTGFDTMMGLLQVANEKRYKIFLLGAKQETLDKVVEKIKTNYPGIQIVGARNGYFDWKQNDIIDQVIDAKPDITFVALGVPKQEQWIAENIHRVESGVMMGVGGSFDAIAGTVKRAPEIWQKLNLEWLYRLIQQPSRWRRMLALPRFALEVIVEKMKGSRHE